MAPNFFYTNSPIFLIHFGSNYIQIMHIIFKKNIFVGLESIHGLQEEEEDEEGGLLIVRMKRNFPTR
jgi:hypothetical protein